LLSWLRKERIFQLHRSGGVAVRRENRPVDPALFGEAAFEPDAVSVREGVHQHVCYFGVRRGGCKQVSVAVGVKNLFDGLARGCCLWPRGDQEGNVACAHSPDEDGDSYDVEEAIFDRCSQFLPKFEAVFL
jgi:hypothetical protein